MTFEGGMNYMAAWLPVVLKAANWLLLTQSAVDVLEKATHLAKKTRQLHKALIGPKKGESNTKNPDLQIQELRAEVDRLSKNEVNQVEVIEQMARQVNAITESINMLRYVSISSLVLGVSAVALVLVLHFSGI
jgi:hypothetical protein